MVKGRVMERMRPLNERSTGIITSRTRSLITGFEYLTKGNAPITNVIELLSISFKLTDQIIIISFITKEQIYIDELAIATAVSSP